jgi:hypothetical protein
VFQVSLAVTAKGKEPHPITSHVTWSCLFSSNQDHNVVYKNVPYSQHQIYVKWPENVFPAHTCCVFQCSDISVIVYLDGFYSIMFPISCLSDFTSLIYFCLISFLLDFVSLDLQVFHIP